MAQHQSIRATRISSSTSRSVITNIMPGIHQRLHRDKGHRLRLSNTYETAPRDQFPEKKVQIIIKEVLEDIIGETEYNAEECRRMSNDISSLVKNKVRQLGCPRYKIVCTVMLGQRVKNALNHVSRCVWNTMYDTFVEQNYENNSTFAVVCVYAVYTE